MGLGARDCKGKLKLRPAKRLWGPTGFRVKKAFGCMKQLLKLVGPRVGSDDKNLLFGNK